MTTISNETLRRTPFYENLKASGGKLVDFHGWELPVEFSGIIDEHNTVRTAVGLFDVSHMGEVLIEGPGAMGLVQRLVTNNAAKLSDGQICYTPMCYPDGTIVDDCLVYRYSAIRFLVVINASNVDKDYAWIMEEAKKSGEAPGSVQVTNLSDSYGQLAIQGPAAERVLATLTRTDLSSIAYYHFVDPVEVAGVSTLVSRTGYTGEDGFEIYVPDIDSAKAGKVWNAVMEAGRPHGIKPIGLGARDTLRLEARLMLYGNDIDETTTPIEAGLSWTVKLKKGVEFNGMARMAEQKASGVARRLVGFEMVGKGVPRHGYPLAAADGSPVGQVTSGSFAPFIKKYIGLGYVKPELTEVGTPLFVEIRGRKVEARVVPTPFYSREK